MLKGGNVKVWKRENVENVETCFPFLVYHHKYTKLRVVYPVYRDKWSNPRVVYPVYRHKWTKLIVGTPV